MALTIIVLAGGIGSRFGREKQKVGLGPFNRSLPEYALLHARQAGFEKAVLVIAEGQKDVWMSFLKERLPSTGFEWKDLILSEQSLPNPEFKRTKPWGTAHALLSGLVQTEGNLMAVNGDDYYGKQAYSIMAEALARKPSNTGLLLPYKLNQTLSKHGSVSRAVCKVDAQGNLSAIQEMYELKEPLDVNPNTPVSMNCWGVDSGIKHELQELFTEFVVKNPGKNEEFGIPHAIEALIAKNNYKVKVLPPAEGWFGITYQQDVEAVNEMLAKIEFRAK